MDAWGFPWRAARAFAWHRSCNLIRSTGNRALACIVQPPEPDGPTYAPHPMSSGIGMSPAGARRGSDAASVVTGPLGTGTLRRRRQPGHGSEAGFDGKGPRPPVTRRYE